jgi:uncharacterized cupredoxin-like copper-binding protein
MLRRSRRELLGVAAVGLAAGLASLISGCAAVGLGGSPNDIVQVRQSLTNYTFTPNHVKVGQHVRFHVEVTDDFSHQFESKGTPFDNIDDVKSKPLDLDWTPNAPGTFTFSCDNPGHKETATFTVEP